MTARRFAIHVLIFLAIILLITAVAIWLNMGPTASSAAAQQRATTAQFKRASVFWRQSDVGKALVKAGDATVFPALEPLLHDDDRHIRANAAFVFAGLGDPRGLETVVAILGDRSDRPLGQGIPGGSFNTAAPRWWLASQIRSDRYYAVHVLGELRDSRGVDVLIQLLGDPEVNYHAAWALGLIGDRRAIQPLIGALEDRDALVRVSAIQALEALDAREALPALQRLLDDHAMPSGGPRLSVADTAKAAMATIKNRD